MEGRKPSRRSKRLRRKEEADRQRAVDESIKTAYAKQDHLLEFPGFLKYERNGLSLYLESGHGDSLSSQVRKYVQGLLKINMEGPYGPEWPAEEKVKRREMVAVEARYLFVRNTSKDAFPMQYMHSDAVTKKSATNKSALQHGLWQGDGDPVVAFAQYRFVIEEDLPVLYVYELQLEQRVHRKGLGKFLMQLLELIARKNMMKAVMLTVQKRNAAVMTFYMSKLRYTISSISPSRADPDGGADNTYEILCKTFDAEAKLKLEEASVFE